MRAKFPVELRRKIGAAAAQGGQLRQVAEEYGCHVASVVRWAADFRSSADGDFPLAHPGAAGHPQALRDIATREVEAGETRQTVAARHGISASTLSAWINS